MNAPPERLIRRKGTHRLIPAKYNPEFASVLSTLADNEGDLHTLFELDAATNERLWAERNLLPGIASKELVYDIPNAHVVNASFIHASPLGGRFNGPDRGAWYAAFGIKTSQTEVAFHKSLEYAEINRFDDTVTYDDYQADFHVTFHDLRGTDIYAGELAPDSYRASQRLAEELLDSGSHGVVYPSVRHRGGTCIACFRPALVPNVVKGPRYRFIWNGSPTPRIEG